MISAAYIVSLPSSDSVVDTGYLELIAPSPKSDRGEATNIN
jgi:hypothetical protein